jgi:hypothetical protein
LKRNWKLDNTAGVGTYKFWHGDPARLPAPWVHRCFDEHPWSKTTQGKCPSAYISGHGRNTGLCVIQKLDNLLYLEYKLEQKEMA